MPLGKWNIPILSLFIHSLPLMLEYEFLESSGLMLFMSEAVSTGPGPQGILVEIY
jgi:hypothetical protein